MVKQETIDKAILDCYTELYKHSEPSIDFNELLKTKKRNRFGQLIIPYDNHEIEQEKFKQIVDKMIKKYKFRGVITNQFRTTIYLGCSPKFKKE